MSVKLQIINKSLVITDEVKGVVIFDDLKSKYYYNSDDLANYDKVSFYQISLNEVSKSTTRKFDIDEVVDESGVKFTRETFADFCRANLGFIECCEELGNGFEPTSLLVDYGFVDNSSNWNTAYGWGNHSEQGYLTSVTTPTLEEVISEDSVAISKPSFRAGINLGVSGGDNGRIDFINGSIVDDGSTLTTTHTSTSFLTNVFSVSNSDSSSQFISSGLLSLWKSNFLVFQSETKQYEFRATSSLYSRLDLTGITSNRILSAPDASGVIPITFSDGTSSVTANTSGVVDLSGLSVGGGINIYNSGGSIPENVIRNVVLSSSSILNIESSTDGGQVRFGDNGTKSSMYVTMKDVQISNDSLSIIASDTTTATIKGKRGLKLELSDSTTGTLISPTVGQALVASTTSGDLEWQTIGGGSSLWTENGNDIEFTTGKVGIGITPTKTLDIKGSATSGFDIIRFSSQYDAEGYIGGDGGGTWFSTKTGGGGSSFKISGDNNAYIKSRNITFRNDNGDVMKLYSDNRLELVGSIKTSQYKLSALNTAPVSATDTGTLGEIRITTDYIYVCVATDTWVRTELRTW